MDTTTSDSSTSSASSPSNSNLLEGEQQPIRQKKVLIVPQFRKDRSLSNFFNNDQGASKSDNATVPKRLILDSESIEVDTEGKAAKDVAPEGPTYREATTKKLLELLECPVCFEILRTGPIFNCRNGHLICPRCKPKLEKCPVCRSPDVDCRNHFAENFALPMLDEETLPCVNHSFGCKHKDLGKKLQTHYSQCLYEQVSCPAHHRRVCTWSGSLVNVVSHAGKNKCAQMLRCPDDRPFISSIGDFNESAFSIFHRITPTYWKPVFLLSQVVIRYFLYFVIYRNERGYWYLYVRSLGHAENIKNLQVKIQVMATKHEPPKDVSVKPDPDSTTTAATATTPKPVYEFQGNISHASLSDEDVIKSGQVLFLCDDQIRALRRDQTLFAYNISVLKLVNGEMQVMHPKISATSSKID